MHYELFLDVLFLENLLLNYFTMRIVNRILKCSATHFRTLAGAGAGAFFYVLWLCFLKEQGKMNTLLVYVVITTCMVRFGCGIRHWRKLLQGILCLHGAAAAGAGTVDLLRHFTGSYGVRTFLLYGTLSYTLLTTGIWLYQYLKGKTVHIYDVVLLEKGRCKKVRGLYDTGNRLKDEITRKPVSVIELEALKELFSEEMLGELEAFSAFQTKSLKKEVMDLNPRYIPFRSVGCSQGLLPVITLDYLWLEGENTRQLVACPALALSVEKCSDAGMYQMILNPNIVDS